MGAFVDAWWRAALSCLHPRVVLCSLLPLAVALGAVFALGWFYWEPTVAGVRGFLERSELLTTLFEWLDANGVPGFRSVLAPLIVVALVVPAIVVAALLLVAWLAAPLLAAHVARRRFAVLARAAGAPGLVRSVGWSLLCTAAAALALVCSAPLWFVLPLVLLLPPWIWGWLAYRVLAFAALAHHADDAERRTLLRRHRWALRTIGLVCGYAAVLPSLLGAGGATTLIFAPLLMLGAVWLYTLIFVFASLWFAHFLLAALARLRGEPTQPAVLAATEALEA